MPKEQRRIVFTHGELRDALENGAGEPKLDLPPGDIVSVAPARRDNRFLIELNVFDYDKRKTQSLYVEEKSIQSALIEYCIGIKTPLPRKPEKVLRIIDEAVCLDIMIGDLGDALGSRGILREILGKQVEMMAEVKRISGHLLGRPGGGEGSAEPQDD